jgi:hypothetical protein
MPKSLGPSNHHLSNRLVVNGQLRRRNLDGHAESARMTSSKTMAITTVNNSERIKTNRFAFSFSPMIHRGPASWNRSNQNFRAMSRSTRAFAGLLNDSAALNQLDDQDNYSQDQQHVNESTERIGCDQS